MSEEIETKGGKLGLKAGQETDWFSGGPNEFKNNHSLSPSPPGRQRLQDKSMFRNMINYGRFYCSLVEMRLENRRTQKPSKRN